MGYFSDHGADEANLEFKLLPVITDEGAPSKNIYLVKASAKYALSKALNDMVNITFEVVAPEEFAGQRVFDRLMFSTKKFEKGNSKGCPLDITLSRLNHAFMDEGAFVDSLEGDLVSEIIPAIVAKLEDYEMCVKVSQKKEEYDGVEQVKNRITQYYPLDAYEEV